MTVKMLLIAAACVIAAGCADIPAVYENPWDSPQSRWSVEKEGLRVDFTLTPVVLDEAQEAGLEIMITDLTASPPRPVTDADAKGKALMPRRPGHIHVLALQELHQGE